MIKDTLREIIHKNRAGYCLDCGKCSAVCPITRWSGFGYASPRLLVEKAYDEQLDILLEDDLFWSCLTCKRCSEICPSDVSFSEFIRDLRTLGRANYQSGVCTHNGVIQTWGQMMTQPGLHQNRLNWLTSDLKVSSHSDTLFFVGCLPYYDILFKKIGYEGVQIAQAAVKIMNYLGIEPQILAEERCCGHDQLWQGDVETFRALAILNLEQLKTSGAKRIVTTCPECARTLKLDYPSFVGSHNMEVLNITELLDLGNLDVSQFKQQAATPHQGEATQVTPLVTYHDPCRLGRHLGIYDAPRQILSDLGLQVAEMPHNRQTSLCCGTSCWTACGSASKNIQVERLREAKASGAEMLVTTCHKCQIHFKCAQADPTLADHIGIELRDLTTLIAQRLNQEVPIADR